MKRSAEVLRLLASLSAWALVVLLFQQPLTWWFRDSQVVDAAARLSPSSLLEPKSAPGFHLEASSEPPGATLRVNGKDRGKTPFIGNVVCVGDEAVLLEVELPPRKVWQRTVRCRQGEVLRVQARLEP